MEERLMEDVVELVATVDPEMMARLENLEERMKTLEDAATSVSASAATGRRTYGVTATSSESGSIEAALEGLTVEQRIAVKAGLLRAGLI